MSPECLWWWQYQAAGSECTALVAPGCRHYNDGCLSNQLGALRPWWRLHYGTTWSLQGPSIPHLVLWQAPGSPVFLMCMPPCTAPAHWQCCQGSTASSSAIM